MKNGFQTEKKVSIRRVRPFLSEVLREPLGTLLMVGGSGAPGEAHAEDCLSAKSVIVAERARVPQASGRRP
jgi:hypothetical protein